MTGILLNYPGAESMPDKYDENLTKNEANYVSLSPLTFLRRSASVYANQPAVIYGNSSYTYLESYNRARRLASQLKSFGIGKYGRVIGELFLDEGMEKSVNSIMIAEGHLYEKTY